MTPGGCLEVCVPFPLLLCLPRAFPAYPSGKGGEGMLEPIILMSGPTVPNSSIMQDTQAILNFPVATRKIKEIDKDNNNMHYLPDIIISNFYVN